MNLTRFMPTPAQASKLVQKYALNVAFIAFTIFAGLGYFPALLGYAILIHLVLVTFVFSVYNQDYGCFDGVTKTDFSFAIGLYVGGLISMLFAKEYFIAMVTCFVIIVGIYIYYVLFILKGEPGDENP